ncbi:uracil-DNA glycosylase, mitochondrial [Trifolium repens]|nr:uracil-DNA glycosylase, mitochondrial [Trifolium repens]
MGIWFSVPEGVKVPSNLVNIFKELKQDLGCSVPSHNNLEKWAVQIMYKVEQNIGYLVKEEGERSYSNANGWKKISSNLSFRY